MAGAKDVTVTGNSATATCTTAAMTTASGPCLLVAIIRHVSATLNSVTNSGTGLTWTKLGSTYQGTETYLAWAPTGLSSQTISANFSASTNSAMVVSSYTGTYDGSGNILSPIGNFTIATGSLSPATASITTLGKNSLVIAGVGLASNNTTTAGSNQTQDGTDASSTTSRASQSHQNSTTATPGTSVTGDFSFTNASWGIMVIEILDPSPGIIISNEQDSLQTGNSSYTISYTVPTSLRDSPYLVVTSHMRSGTDPMKVNSMTYGGQTMTLGKAVYNNVSPITEAEIWYLKNPPTGANNLVVTYNATCNSHISFSMLTGVDGDNPIDNTTSATGATANPSLNITTNGDGALVISAVAHELSTSPTGIGTGQTYIFNKDDGTWVNFASQIIKGTAGTQTMSYTIGADGWSHVIVAFRPSVLLAKVRKYLQSVNRAYTY